MFFLCESYQNRRGEVATYKENPVPQPDPSVKVVKTHLKDCLLGVKIKSAIQMASEARTLIGANHNTISCRVFVVKEHIIPNMINKTIERRTICKAVLHALISV